MKNALHFKIQSQPDETTCGPTCLQAVYQYFDDGLPLERVIADIPALDEGGTLAVLLGCHALRRGYSATIYTFNLKVFDPSWFKGGQAGPGELNVAPRAACEQPTSTSQEGSPARDDQPAANLTERQRFLIDRLNRQMAVKDSSKLRLACQSYAQFLALGGAVEMHDLNAGLIRHYLDRRIPVLTGLSATYLYRCQREIARTNKPDDVRGVPTGHFVVLCGYHSDSDRVAVADPYLANPLGVENYYDVHVERLICAILLGVITYDANLLIIRPQ